MRIFQSLLLLLAFLKSAVAAEAVKPNIILIISDDHGFPDYGFMGNHVVRTPHIDRMAAQGLLYTRGYSMSVCSPSLASLLTGRLPHQHGITGNDLSEAQRPEGTGKEQKRLREPLSRQLLSNPLILPRALSEAGYLTFQSGKLWNVTAADIGFTSGMTDTAGRHGDAGLTIGRKGMKPVFDFIDQAQAQKKPFFVWYAPMMPHSPHNPPETLLAHYKGKGLPPAAEKYFAMVEWFDQTCGQLDDYLAKNKLVENTVILYLADNGWDATTGAGPRAKLSPYELGIRTPIFVRWPRKIQPRRDDKTLASLIDIAPSILKMAGAKVPVSLPGLDLLNRKAMVARASLAIENYTHNIADLARPAASVVTAIVISGWDKLLIPGSVRPDVAYTTAPEELELFDLKSDPFERNNIAPRHPKKVKRLQAMQTRM